MDEETNLQKYYRVNIDTRFIDIQVKGKLPDLNFETLQLHVNDNNSNRFLKRGAAAFFIRFEGFSVVTVNRCNGRICNGNHKGEYT